MAVVTVFIAQGDAQVPFNGHNHTRVVVNDTNVFMPDGDEALVSSIEIGKCTWSTLHRFQALKVGKHVVVAP